MVFLLSLLDAVLFLEFAMAFLLFAVSAVLLWRYLEGADWGRFNFLRSSLFARLLTGIVIAYVFWIFFSIAFGSLNSWLFSVFGS